MNCLLARFARVSTAVGALIRGLLAGVFLALACAASTATESPPSLDQYQRTSWDSKDGAPAGVWAIAQTSDGWLWFGGPTGLYRFDGVRFTRMALEPAGSTRSEHVSALFATDAVPLLIGRVGTLWVSTPTEVIHLPRGARGFEQVPIKVVGYGELIESPDGRAWIADIKGG